MEVEVGGKEREKASRFFVAYYFSLPNNPLHLIYD